MKHIFAQLNFLKQARRRAVQSRSDTRGLPEALRQRRLSNSTSASPPEGPDAHQDRASVWKMSIQLYPSGLVFVAVTCSVLIETAYPHGDSRNFFGPCIALIAMPLAGVGWIRVFKEAKKPAGEVALAYAVLISIAWPSEIFLGFCAVIEFGWLKHAM